jgi:aryl-alcohol dehydrogenase-like predicted oxidoreductase
MSVAIGDDIFVIPGTRKEKYLLDNVAGGALQLSKAEVDEVRNTATTFEVSGDRYPEAAMKSLNH